MVALQEKNELARADMYKGHKVVVMPARDVVSSHNTFNGDRPRSLSAGRAQTRSRDIVQEVYDRMGVSRDASADAFSPTRGRSTAPQPGREQSGADPADKFSQRYMEAAALSSSRGRGADPGLNEERRSRSLSRGRALAGRWPPAPANDSPIQAPVKPWKKEELGSVAAVPLSPNWTGQNSRSESQEDNEDNDSLRRESQEDATTSTPSVKERISAYAGVRTSRSFSTKKPVHYNFGTPRERPPKIDIYQEARKLVSTSKKGDDNDKSAVVAPVPSAIPPSPAAAAAADAAAELVYRRSSGWTPKSIHKATNGKSTPKAINGISGGYLAAIKSPPSTSKPVAPVPTEAPLAEISAADGYGDGYSVAASSVSVDDFVASPTCNRGEYALAKKPSWSERGKHQVSPTARSANEGTSRQAKPAALPSADIDKIVEQRVQARISVIEMRLEEQMQRLEKRMEERMKTKINLIDEKIDKMNSMLAMLLSREFNGCDNENRENEI